MYTGPDSDPADLPSSARLIKSTVVALVMAGVILVTVVLPAEHAIDPTGIGGWLGLTEMGEIKADLEVAAAVDHEGGPVPDVPEPVAAGRPTADGWTDELTLTLAPDEAIEMKLMMKKGAEASFEWATESGSLNYDLHGDGGGEFTSYEQGTFSTGKSGTVRAAFDGQHGWYWRNRTTAPVTLTLRTRGAYSELKRTM